MIIKLIRYLVRKKIMSPGNPSKYSDEEVALILKQALDTTVKREVRGIRRYEGEEEAEKFSKIRLELIEVGEIGHNSEGELVIIALVRSSIPVAEFHDLALAYILGTRQDWARRVYEIRSGYFPEPMDDDELLVYISYDNEWDFWCFLSSQDEDREAENETYVAIGEPVQLQNSWKEPPYAVTVLGRPEVSDDASVRIPVRVTALTPIWRIDEDFHLPAYLAPRQTDQDSESAIWESVSSSLSSLPLVKGGTHEGFALFKLDSDKPGADELINFLNYFDETGEVIEVNLSRNSPPAERVRFQDGHPGTLWDAPPVDEIEDRLSGSQWEAWWKAVAPPPVAGIGDTVLVKMPDKKPQPWFDLTALGAPEAFDERTLRIRLRIASRMDDLRVSHLDFLLSTGPDEYGRMHHLWESEFADESTTDRPDSFGGVSLTKGQSHEAFAYFTASDGQVPPPPESFSVLWYGERLFELPIMLSK